jgi:hypothetical protein
LPHLVAVSAVAGGKPPAAASHTPMRPAVGLSRSPSDQGPALVEGRNPG